MWRWVISVYLLKAAGLRICWSLSREQNNIIKIGGALFSGNHNLVKTLTFPSVACSYCTPDSRSLTFKFHFESVVMRTYRKPAADILNSATVYHSAQVPCRHLFRELATFFSVSTHEQAKLAGTTREPMHYIAVKYHVCRELIGSSQMTWAA